MNCKKKSSINETLRCFGMQCGNCMPKCSYKFRKNCSPECCHTECNDEKSNEDFLECHVRYIYENIANKSSLTLSLCDDSHIVNSNTNTVRIKKEEYVCTWRKRPSRTDKCQQKSFCRYSPYSDSSNKCQQKSCYGCSPRNCLDQDFSKCLNKGFGGCSGKIFNPEKSEYRCLSHHILILLVLCILFCN